MLVSFIIPTFNNAATLPHCLASIAAQRNHSAAVETIIIDGGSVDGTVALAQAAGVHQILTNQARIEEKGRPLGIRAAQGQLLCFLDADNILPDAHWLAQMLRPFAEPDVVGAEPLYYLARPGDSLATRYCALIGGDDPIAVGLGHTDRWNSLTGRWTDAPLLDLTEGDHYLRFRLLPGGPLPTLGANGFLVRAEALAQIHYDPFYHLDVIYHLVEQGLDTFAKVPAGLIHWQGSLPAYFRRKYRRIIGRLSPSSRAYHLPLNGRLAGWLLRTLLLWPLWWDVLRGWHRDPDRAWLFHPAATLGTLAIYGWVTGRTLLAGQPPGRY